jgi:hypothetical protein
MTDPRPGWMDDPRAPGENPVAHDEAAFAAAMEKSRGDDQTNASEAEAFMNHGSGDLSQGSPEQTGF